MTMLTDALALTKSKTDQPTQGSCDKFVGDDVDCETCGENWASHVRGFGSKQQPLGEGRVKRVPRA